MSSHIIDGLSNLGRHEDALREAKQTREAFLRVLGPDHHMTISNESSQGFTLIWLGRFGEAVRVLEKVLESIERKCDWPLPMADRPRPLQGGPWLPLPRLNHRDCAIGSFTFAIPGLSGSTPTAESRLRRRRAAARSPTCRSE